MNAIARRAELACRLAELRRLASKNVAQGFGLAAEDLIEAAERGGRWADPGWKAFGPEAKAHRSTA
jgi:hypothetical protein